MDSRDWRRHPGCLTGYELITSQHRREAFAAALLAGGPLPDDVVEQLRAGVRAWCLASDERPLAVYLGLPSTPARVRLAARNAHLRHAALLLCRGDTWQTAKALAEAARHFNRRIWPAWMTQLEPPCYATPLERALWTARQAGDGALPETAQAMRAVIS